MNVFRYIYAFLPALAVMASSCTKSPMPVEGGEISQGETVMFTTLLPYSAPGTKSPRTDWEAEVRTYRPVQQPYTFNVEMWKEDDGAKTADSDYRPVVVETVYSEDGTLQNVENPLYWQDNVNRWGFKATAGTESLAADQSSQEKWLAQDRLVGYSYLPLWDGANERGTDAFDAINYRTSKEWYAGNKLAKDLSGLMVTSSEDYKKIPLYFQHQRAWVTVILKAGEGVTREALAYATSGQNIAASIFSHGVGEPLAVNAWSSEALVDYDADKNGLAATNVSTTRYDAIVEPYNFLTNAETDKIASINVSNQKFTFAAANDTHYAGFLNDVAADVEAMQAYNLTAGKHLTITATLTRASRLILITAWIEDWTETVTQTICDDYGKNGDPFLIYNRGQLDRFLKDTEKNVAGNVAMIVPGVMSLADTTWTASDYTLKATLNLAGANLTIDRQILNEVDRSGSIINGTISFEDDFDGEAAVASVNKGTLERLNIVSNRDPKIADPELSPAKATKAGVVVTNYGTIYQCSSALTVHGAASGYVGGIAAESKKEAGVEVIPVIDACTVTARVDGDAAVTAGGGIVGLAEGRVSNNVYQYGVTLLQNQSGTKYYNIIAAIGGSGGTSLTNHANNSWPTTERYTVQGTEVEILNANTSARYTAVIDCREELAALLESGYNNSSSYYRIAKSFSVEKENWIWGSAVLDENYFVNDVDTDHSHGCVKFKLDGNGKTVTLTSTDTSLSATATMLFGNILGEIHDLNIYLAKPIVAQRIVRNDGIEGDSNSDAIAALAFRITAAGGSVGSVSNINLKGDSGAYIQASTPGGIAVWATYGGKLTDCASNVPVRMHVVGAGTDARRYAGGIVACAEKTTITRCIYYADNGIGWATNSDAPKAQGNNCRYGGIVGGTTEIAGSSDAPSVVLTDCQSWWLWDAETWKNVAAMKGSLIGSTVYHDNITVKNAMAADNAGNWWQGTVGAGLLAPGETEEKVIGKKNSISPVKPVEWQ